MSQRFNAAEGLIIVRARLWGPDGDTVARLALDTGATSTVIGSAVCVTIGCTPSATSERVRMTTGSSVEYAPKVTLNRVRALGHERTGFEVVVHTLPPSAAVDGLLGLDFMRQRRLDVDFISGRLSLTS